MLPAWQKGWSQFRREKAPRRGGCAGRCARAEQRCTKAARYLGRWGRRPSSCRPLSVKAKRPGGHAFSTLSMVTLTQPAYSQNKNGRIRSNTTSSVHLVVLKCAALGFVPGSGGKKRQVPAFQSGTKYLFGRFPGVSLITGVHG